MHGSPTEYNSSFTKGFEVEGFSVPEKKVFESLNGEINTNIDKRVKNHAQGDKQRDWHWNARMSHDTTTYAVPICHGAFQYGDKEYHVWVGGHDVETIRADDLPVDKDKQKTANIGFMPGALGLVTAIGSAYYWSFVWSSLIATVVAIGYGFLRRKALIDYSKSIRNSLLIQMQASNQVANLSDEEQDKVAKGSSARILLNCVSAHLLPLKTVPPSNSAPQIRIHAASGHCAVPHFQALRLLHAHLSHDQQLVPGHPQVAQRK